MSVPPTRRLPADVTGVLERRARALAEPERPAADGARAELLLLTSGGVRYAVEVQEVLAVVATRAITRVPAAPPFVIGVMVHRGGMMPVLDLARVTGLRPDGPGGGYVVVLGRIDEAVGVRADAVELVAIPADAIRREGVAEAHASYVRGVTPDGIVVLTGAGLAHAPELTVQEAVPAFRREVG